MPFPRRLRLLVELEEPPSVPQAAADLEAGPIAVEGDAFRPQRLQLYRPGASGGGGFEDFHRPLEAAHVVARHFGDDERRCPGADAASRYGEAARGHTAFRFPALK